MSRTPASVETHPVHLEVRVNGYTTLNFEVEFPARGDQNGKRAVWVRARKCPASSMVRPGAACTMEFPDSSVRNGIVREIEDRPESVALKIELGGD